MSRVAGQIDGATRRVQKVMARRSDFSRETEPFAAKAAPTAGGNPHGPWPSPQCWGRLSGCQVRTDIYSFGCKASEENKHTTKDQSAPAGVMKRRQRGGLAGVRPVCRIQILSSRVCLGRRDNIPTARPWQVLRGTLNPEIPEKNTPGWTNWLNPRTLVW